MEDSGRAAPLHRWEESVCPARRALGPGRPRQAGEWQSQRFAGGSASNVLSDHFVEQVVIAWNEILFPRGFENAREKSSVAPSRLVHFPLAPAANAAGSNLPPLRGFRSPASLHGEFRNRVLTHTPRPFRIAFVVNQLAAQNTRLATTLQRCRDRPCAGLVRTN